MSGLVTAAAEQGPAGAALLIAVWNARRLRRLERRLSSDGSTRDDTAV